jgi:hypothetical protein
MFGVVAEGSAGWGRQLRVLSLQRDVFGGVEEAEMGYGETRRDNYLAF